MFEIKVPQEDSNSETGIIISINKPNLSSVKKRDVLFEVETNKAVFEVFAEIDGYVSYTFELKDEVTFNTIVGYIEESKAKAKMMLTNLEKDEPKKIKKDIKLTAKAKKIIKEYSIDISSINKKGVITEKDLLPLISEKKDDPFLDIEKYPSEIKKVLIIGGSFGAHQVIDILDDYTDVRIVGIVDDDKGKHGKIIFGNKIIGSTDKIDDLFESNYFSHAIIAISGNVVVRKALYEKCLSLKIPMVNAIDKSCTIRKNVTIGKGNVINGNTYIGAFTVIGDNNFLSANTSIDHHNIWHSHISIGPNCVTSGLVEVKNRCRFGMGVNIEPHLIIGENSTIASGSIISSSIPNKTVVKMKSNLKKSTKEEE